MFCPNCGQEQRCPCDSCKKQHGKTDVWVWQEDEETISCCGCGLTVHADWWQSLSFDIHKAGIKQSTGKLSTHWKYIRLPKPENENIKFNVKEEVF